ncbi:MAG TPA: ABC transporter substrate-binding protein [Methylomirabilota bacterium]|nr:ABC transporter substrate-binding protein [Methylomirabilota bacterium]
MANLPLTLATRDYDHVMPLATGDVRIEGVDLHLIRSFDALSRVTGEASIDGGEASFSRYVQRLAGGDRALVGLPVFLMREFRHRNFYVRRDAGLRSLADLAGRRVGLDAWPNSGNTWSRALMREAGVPPERVRWVVGRVHAHDAPPPADPLPAGVELAKRPLRDMLVDGELDVLIWAWTPDGFYDADSPLTRLFEDYVTAERAHYQQTRLFPAHHVLVLKRGVVERAPQLLRAVYAGFEAARAHAARQRWTLHESSPWLLADLEAQARLMGPEAAGYGVRSPENRAMVARFCTEQHAQGLIARPLDPAAVFADFEALAG